MDELSEEDKMTVARARKMSVSITAVLRRGSIYRSPGKYVSRRTRFVDLES